MRPLCFVAGMLLLCIGTPAAAQRLILDGTFGMGTGASFGSADENTIVMMSPVFVDMNVIVSNTEFRNIEYVVGFRAELQGQVTAAVVPQLRFTMDPKKWTVYGIIGAPFVAAPRRMLGIEVGAGVYWQLKPKFALFADAMMNMFIMGNDLPDDAIVVQLNAVLGIRVKFK